MKDPMHSRLTTLTMKNFVASGGVPVEDASFWKHHFLPITRINAEYEFQFEKGKICVTTEKPLMLQFVEQGPSLMGNYREQEQREREVRDFLMEVKHDQCFLDCGSIGRCYACTRRAKDQDQGNDQGLLKDFYHKIGETRHADADELDAICMDIWICLAPIWDSFSIRLLEQGLHASDQEIIDAQQRFAKNHLKRR